MCVTTSRLRSARVRLDRMPSAALTDRALARLAQAAIASAVRLSSRGKYVTDLLRGELCDLEVVRDVAYGRARAQRLDVVKSSHAPRGAPSLLYLHGGGFQLAAKETHFWLAATLARAGFVVFNASYRLAPEHPYPAAVDDASDAYAFIAREARHHGADASRCVFGGESAGANLCLGLALAESGLVAGRAARHVPPRALLLFCGLLQVSHTLRFATERHLPRIVRARIESISRDYARREPGARPPTPIDPLLDPLPFLEQRPEAFAALPPIYASVGGDDPVLSDTLRLSTLFRPKDVLDVYPGEPHAFQAMPFRAACGRSWERCAQFLAGVSR
jgi:acetyl esterase